ncbi:MAG: TonB-dependent receptor, partial [Treponema sp.]|nr:TonB-dependent receptor [Treponema sp.]
MVYMKRFLLTLLLAGVVCFFLYAEEGEEAWDEVPVMEGEGLTFTEEAPPGGEIQAVGTQETTQQIAVIDQEEIARRQAADLPALLEEVLDAGITRYGAYGNAAQVNLRGFDGKRVAILINGIPANSPRTGDFDFSTIDINSIDRIEVIYGGSDTKYNVSGALGGVINIITVKKQESGLRWGGGFSSTSYFPGSYNETGGAVHGARWQDLADTQMLSLFLGYGAAPYSLSINWFGNRAANHYLYEDYYGYARRKEHNEIWDTGLRASLVRDLPNRGALLVSGNLYYGDRNFPVTGTSNEAVNQDDFKSSGDLILDLPRIFRDDLAVEASLSHSFVQTVYGDTAPRRDNYLTGINRWSWYPAAFMALKAGIDARFVHVNAVSGADENHYNGGLYFAVDFQPVQQFLAAVSVKGVSDGHDTALIPKLGFVWKPAGSFTLKNNYFRSFRFPSFDELYWSEPNNKYRGNPDLLSEDGAGAD